MGLFSKKSSKKSDVAMGQPSTGVKEKGKSQSSHLKPAKSNSTHSTNSSFEKDLAENRISTNQSSFAPEPKIPKRLSTIVDDDQFSNFSKDDYYSSGSSVSELESNSDSESDFEHRHALFDTEKSNSVSQLSTLMGLCGLGTSKETLTRVANEESKQTFSLITPDIKIQRLSPTMRHADLHASVIGEYQLNQIKVLKKRISDVLANPKHLKETKTLFERYGRVTDIIGRGSYGVIKIIERETAECKSKPLYAVKELCKKNSTETHDQFIDRAISEFIISSTLNNKNIVRTIDLMVATSGYVKLCQVMDCFTSGNLFSYCQKAISNHHYIAIDEVDCMVKQITKGLWYMHNHGVAHCDLKLENILIESDKNGRMVLKLSDFGKSSVFRTKWDTHEQLSPAAPMGSGPYMTPEEYDSRKEISLAKKDCWALGIISLMLFNIRRSYFHESNLCTLEYYDHGAQEEDTKSYSNGYLWHSTEPKVLTRSKKYKDSVFDEYMKSSMLSKYDPVSKDWIVKRKGEFLPIETLFAVPKGFEGNEDRVWKDDLDQFEEGDFEIRKFCIYKLLDPEYSTRMSPDALLKSDWLKDVELCCD